MPFYLPWTHSFIIRFVHLIKPNLITTRIVCLFAYAYLRQLY